MTSETIAPADLHRLPTEAPAPRRSFVPLLILGLIVLVAAALRFDGINWDDGKLLHPDERHIVMVMADRIHAPVLDLLLDPDRSPLNTRSVDPNPPPGQPARNRQFAYGSLPLFATDFAAAIWGRLTGENWNDLFKVYLVGRVLTVIFDLATVVLAFVLARRAYGAVAGLLTAAFFALAVMPIQLAHFFVTDTWLTTFITAALLAALVAVERGDSRFFALAGFCTGCAMATKSTAVLLAFPLLVAVGLAASGRARGGRPSVARVAGWAVATAGAAFVAFLLFEPYAVLDPRTYLRDLGEQSAIISGTVDAPYTRQFVGTLPLLYQAKNLAGWALGPLLGALTLVGLIWGGWRAVRQRGTADIILISWIVPYLALLAAYEAKFLRYLLPVVPPLLALGAAALSRLGAFEALTRRPQRQDGARARQRFSPNGAHGSPPAGQRWRTAAASLLTIGVLAGTGLMAVAFGAIYQRPHPRIAASEWIYANIPAQSRISAEVWDDQLPLRLDPGRSILDYQYESVEFSLYDDTPACDRQNPRRATPEYCAPNNEATFSYLAEKLEKTDYIIESSARLYGSIPRLPWRYPVQQQYFTLLFAGRLGFTPVYDGTSFPTLGGVAFNDQFMDESFTVYDHPRVTIFRKERQLSRDELRALFAPAIERPLSPTRQPKTNTLLLDRLVDRLPSVSDYAWNARLGDNGAGATLLWFLLVEGLGLLALPLTLWLFRHFPDRGWGLSKLIGWLLLAYPVWLAASLRLGRFTLPYLLLAVLIGAALSGAAAFRWRGPLRAIVRGAGRAIVLSEAIFLSTAAFFLLLRLRNPDLWHPYWGGEKPMELAYLNAILRSVNFPPYDPWFADGTINYYYYGQYLVAVLMKLTGIPTEIAFNLAMPTISGLVAAAAGSVAAALAHRALRRRKSPALPLAFGALGSLLFVGAGNLDGAARLIGRLREQQRAPLGFDYFWGASRAIDGAITEFPFFTQLWADLHAHAVALPLTLLALATAVALTGDGRSETTSASQERRTIGEQCWFVAGKLAPYLALQAVTLGALACTNSWDVPTYLLVTGAGLFHAAGLRGRGGRGEVFRRLAVAVLGTAATGLVAYALYLPFFRAFKALVGSLARTRVPSPLVSFLDHFGLFVAVVVVILTAGFLVRARVGPTWRRSVALSGGAGAVVAAVLGLNAVRLTAWLASNTRFFPKWVPWTGLPVPATGLGLTAALLAALLVLLLTLWVLAWDDARLQVPLVLLIAATGVTLGPEIVFVADDLQGGDWERMNTVFKFYLQGWSLFALGSVGALAWLYDTAPRWSLAPFRRVRDRVDRRFNASVLRALTASFLALLLAGALVYPVVATPIRLAERFPEPPGLGLTLNGYRWMAYGTAPNERCQPIGFAGDYAAIRWLSASVTGTPVIAEASIGPYRGNGSRFANATGLPTVLGWDRHEYQQRPPAGIQQRMQDVRTLYNSPNEGEKLAILQRYHVSFVVVGAVERHWYLPPPPGTPACAANEPYAAPAGLAALEGMAGRYLEAVFRSDETVIYRVLPAANSSGLAAGEWAPR